MDEALKKSGEYPNIALTPGTHVHAATGEAVEIPEWASVDSTSSDSDAVAFCKRVERAAKERAPLELFGVSYEAVDNEPFCETVYRWLNGDAPQECRECTDGKYDKLTVLVDGGTCKPMPDGTCPSCGEMVARAWEAVRLFDGTVEYRPTRYWNYCPNCGRKVVDE